MTPLCASPVPPAWQAGFLAILPAIERYARCAFRHLRGDDFDDAVQETVAHSCVAYVRLVQRNRGDRAFPTALVRFAVAQIRDGRRVGNRLRIGDVLSCYAQRHKEIVVERLNWWDQPRQEWFELTIADHRLPIPDQVCFRLDFQTWLKRLTPQQLQIVTALMDGHRPGEVARMCDTSPSWISQLRRRLQASWEAFQADSNAAAAECHADRTTHPIRAANTRGAPPTGCSVARRRASSHHPENQCCPVD